MSVLLGREVGELLEFLVMEADAAKLLRQRVDTLADAVKLFRLGLVAAVIRQWRLGFVAIGDERPGTGKEPLERYRIWRIADCLVLIANSDENPRLPWVLCPNLPDFRALKLLLALGVDGLLGLRLAGKWKLDIQRDKFGFCLIHLAFGDKFVPGEQMAPCRPWDIAPTGCRSFEIGVMAYADNWRGDPALVVLIDL